MKKIVPSIIFACLILWVAFICIPSFYWFQVIFNSVNFDSFRNVIIEHFNSSYLVDKIDAYYLSPRHFTAIFANIKLVVSLFLLLIGVCIACITIIYRSAFGVDINTPRISQHQWKIFSFMLLAWLIYKVFLFNYFPLHIDEIFDFVHFSRKDLLVRHSYQFTDGANWANNHIFYTDISNFLLRLRLPDKLAIRLPSIIGEAMILLTIYVWAEKENVNKTIFTVGIVALSFWSSIYSIEGRSYMLIAFFCFGSFASLELYRTSKNTLYLLLLLLCLSLGFATNKLFALPCLGLFFYSLTKFSSYNFKEKAQLFIIVVCTALLAVLFYFPVFLLSGWGNIIPSSSKSEFHNLQRLFPVLLEGISVMTNINSKAYLTLLVLPTFYLVFRKLFTVKTKSLYLFLGAQLLVLGIFSIVTTSYLPFRAMIYLNVLFSILLAYSIYDIIIILNKKRKMMMVIFILLIGANTIFNFHFSWLNQLDQFINGKTLYSKLDDELALIKRLEPTRILIQKDLHFHLFYSKFRFEGKTSEFYQIPILQVGDVIITKEPLSKMKVTIKSEVDDAFLQKME